MSQSKFSVTLRNGRISKLEKFLSTITKGKSNYYKSGGNLSIQSDGSIVKFVVVSNQINSMYEYWINEGNDMQNNLKEESVINVNVEEFMSNICKKDSDLYVVKIFEENGALNFQ
jgi:hypothetical protein